MNNNLISTCYVVEHKNYGVEPVIYLSLPVVENPNLEDILPFGNPFDAKNFIRNVYKSEIAVLVKRGGPDLTLIKGKAV